MFTLIKATVWRHTVCVPLFPVGVRFGTMPWNSFDSSTVVKQCLPFSDGVMPVYTDETSHNAYGIKETCYSVYVFINPCKAFSAQPQTSPASTYSQALLHPSQGIKYPSVVAINIHPGSSISSQFWFSLLFVIRPQALCGVSLCILAEKTP